jgi:hypothetical protein
MVVECWPMHFEPIQRSQSLAHSDILEPQWIHQVAWREP